MYSIIESTKKLVFMGFFHQKEKELQFYQNYSSSFMEAPPGFEPGNQGVADPCLTTWL